MIIYCDREKPSDDKICFFLSSDGECELCNSTHGCEFATEYKKECVNNGSNE